MSRLAVAGLAAVLALAACESRRVDPLEQYAASACAVIQSWIDAVEDRTTELSRTVTAIDDASERVEHHRAYARSVRERTDDVVRQLGRIAPTVGEGAVAAARLNEALERSLAVTDELVVLADSFPDGDDPESLTSRISSLLVRLEKAFTYPKQTRTALAERHDAFADAPACVDYDDAVT